jgi:hypothetical protein
MKDVQKRFNLESKNSQTGTPQSLIFAETSSQATPNASKANLFKARNECVLSKNSSKAVKFDKGKQFLALRCISRLGVASQASFVPNEKQQRKADKFSTLHHSKFNKLEKPKPRQFRGHKKNE